MLCAHSMISSAQFQRQQGNTSSSSSQQQQQQQRQQQRQHGLNSQSSTNNSKAELVHAVSNAVGTKTADNKRKRNRRATVFCFIIAITITIVLNNLGFGIVAVTVTGFSARDPLGGVKVFFKRSECENCNLITEREMIRTKNDRVTVVVQGYSPLRKPNYAKIFKEYSKMMPDVVDRIVFVWNNVRVKPPAYPTENENVFMIQADANHMMNRFVLGDEHIRTDNVLTIDDDVVITKGLLRCMINMLSKFPDTIVGLDSRRIQPEIPSYLGGPVDVLKYPAISIGKTFLMKTKYRKYFREADRVLLDSVLNDKPCEHCDDLVAHALLTNISKQGVVWLERNIWPNVRVSLPAPEGVSNKKDWYGKMGKRSECVGYLRDYFEKDGEVFLKTPFPVETRCLAEES